MYETRCWQIGVDTGEKQTFDPFIIEKE